MLTGSMLANKVLGQINKKTSSPYGQLHIQGQKSVVQGVGTFFSGTDVNVFVIVFHQENLTRKLTPVANTLDWLLSIKQFFTNV